MKIVVKNYTFNRAAKQITFTDYASITLENIFAIINATSNIVIFQSNNPLFGGTVAGNVLTLTYDTSAMYDEDKLTIFYWDEKGVQVVANNNVINIDTNIGAKADSVATTDTGTFSLISLFKRLLQKDYSTSAKQDILLASQQESYTDLETIVLLLSQMVNKMGFLTGLGATRVDLASSGALASVGTVTTVTTVTNCTNLGTLATLTSLNQFGGQQANAMPSAMSNAGLQIIYNNILIS